MSLIFKIIFFLFCTGVGALAKERVSVITDIFVVIHFYFYTIKWVI